MSLPSSLHLSKLFDESNDNKLCGSKKGPVKNRWTKPELVERVVSNGLMTRTKANKLTLVKLCEFLGLKGASSPRASSPRASSPRASHHSSPREKQCGPLRGPNRYTKPELVAFAVSHGMTKAKASKMTIAQLCRLMKSPSASPRSSPHHGSHHSSPRHGSPTKKRCGPKYGPNRYTKPELVAYFVSNGLLKESVAKKMTISELCYYFKASPTF